MSVTGDDIIGSRLVIESDGVEPMGGTVVRYNPHTGEHDVLLDSGITVTLDLNEEEVLVDEGDGDHYGGGYEEQYAEEQYEDEYEEEYEERRPPPRRASRRSPAPPKRRGRNHHGHRHISAHEDEDEEDDDRSVGSTGSVLKENFLYQKKKVRRGGEIVGFNCCIFNNEDPESPPLEGIILSYDPYTACHSIKFDTGLELDIDLAEENVSFIPHVHFSSSLSLPQLNSALTTHPACSPHTLCSIRSTACLSPLCPPRPLSTRRPPPRRPWGTSPTSSRPSSGC